MATTRILKVTVLTTGELLLDGVRTSVQKLEQVIKENEGTKLIVWYYREDAGKDEPPVALKVMKLLVEHRLPIRLSSNPDFSDAISDIGQSLERAFASIREKAAAGQLVILRPDGRVLGFPALQNGPPEAIAAVEKMLPSHNKRNVAVIGETEWTLQQTVDLPSANQAIPFFGLLMGFSCLGHAVWVFNPKVPSVLSAACRDADVLIVDSARCSALPAGWQVSAQKTMRNKQIFIHDRATHKLQKA